jgi:hypothetical protein
MNCPQCQTANGPGSAFCGNCGAQMTVAPAAAPAGYPPPQGAGTPLGYAASSSAPTGFDAPQGYNASGGTPQQPAGYPQGQYQPPPTSGYTPGSAGPVLPQVNFDLNRATTVDKVVGVASLIALISIWLPWFTASYSGGAFGASGSASASATTAHGGWMYLEFIVALVLIAYLVARIAWERLPFSIPVAHAPLLIVGTAIQLLIMLIAFFDLPSADGVAGFSIGWGWGAFVGLLAALVAAGPVIYPAVRSYLASRNAAAGPR